MLSDKVIASLTPLLNQNAKVRDIDNILFTVESLAKYLQVSKQWVYERVHLNEIPYLKMRKFPRFRKSEIDKWLDKNRGLSVVVGKDTGIITTLNKSKDGERDQRPITNQNPGQFKLIDELSQEDQALLLDGIDYRVLKKILELNSWDTDDVILVSIEDLNNQDKADLLIDVLLLLRDKKNKSKIEKRINDYKGEYISFENVNEENLEICDGSDEIVKLKNIDANATRIALESADYRSWMLYMHPWSCVTTPS